MKQSWSGQKVETNPYSIYRVRNHGIFRKAKPPSRTTFHLLQDGYMCIYAYLCVHTSTYIYICSCICVCMCIYIYMCIYTVGTYRCTSLDPSIYLPIYRSVYLSLRICGCIICRAGTGSSAEARKAGPLEHQSTDHDSRDNFLK